MSKGIGYIRQSGEDCNTYFLLFVGQIQSTIWPCPILKHYHLQQESYKGGGDLFDQPLYYWEEAAVADTSA